ncbi:hypothetical protein [Microvirus mar13]|uniref:Uncharacterized protein n=1 Tax=Microvirus mar13 TaxID=2851145 RepID=A0A8F5MIR9_9VIRU|nr:hypothetical protein [Microvirus mar13]
MWFIDHWQLLLEIAFAAVGVVYAVCVFLKTRNISKTLNAFKEVYDLKYKTLETNKKQRPKPTEFSEYKDAYVLNPATNELEKLPTQENIQERINSFLECALDRALEKFMPKNVVERDDVAEEYAASRVDLADLADAMEIAEQYRERFGLSENASMADIYARVDKEAAALKAKLDSFSAPAPTPAPTPAFEEVKK